MTIDEQVLVFTQSFKAAGGSAEYPDLEGAGYITVSCQAYAPSEEKLKVLLAEKAKGFGYAAVFNVRFTPHDRPWKAIGDAYRRIRVSKHDSFP